MTELELLISRLNRSDPASSSELAECLFRLNFALPNDYVEFFEICNGAEGFIKNDVYISLWSVNDLANLNTAYQVCLNAPGLFLFGSDGADEGFGFDMRDRSMPVVTTPFVGMDWAAALPTAASFTDFLRQCVGGQ